MKIENQELEHSLLMWSALNYKYQTVYVVAYGLQVKQFDTKAKALKEYRECKAHSKQCNKVI